MRISDLGSLLVEVEGNQQSPPGRKPAAILAMLTIHAGRRVSADALAEVLWGNEVSPGAMSTLESHVWRLRLQLEPHRRRRETPRVLISDTGGYRLVLGPDQIDSNQLERLVDDARGILTSGPGESALGLVDAALRLWRGRPYSPFSDAEWAVAAVARLEEAYLQARELRVEALLHLSRSAEALLESETLMRESEYGEHPCALRMRALHRAGRTEEALATLQRFRGRLLDELGLEPGAELSELQRQILEQDPALLATSRRTVTFGAQDHPTNLPGRRSAMIGRESELREIQELVTAGAPLTITGPAGCGKTRLAIEVAGGLAPRFPEGVWFIDLTAIETVGQAPTAVIDALGLTVGIDDQRALALGAYLQSRRILLVLDNCEHLLPGLNPVIEAMLGRSSCLSSVLATSREPLLADGERIFTLKPLPVPGLADDPQAPPTAAVELFLARATAADPSLKVDGDALGTVGAICVGLDGLPLAIELAAARVRTYSIEEISDQVTRDPVTLSRLNMSNRDDHHQSVGEAIDWSVQLLSPAERRVHEALSVLPGRFTLQTARAVTDVSQPDRDDLDVEMVMPMLVNRSLLSSERSSNMEGRSTFRQLSTVRTHAARLLDGAGRTQEILERRDRFVLHRLSGLPRIGRPETATTYAAVEDDYPAVMATLQRTLADRRDSASAVAPSQLLYFWVLREQLSEGIGWLRLAVELADESHVAEAVHVVAHDALAHALFYHGRPDLARRHVDTVARLLPTLDESALVSAGDLLPALAVQAAIAEDFAASSVLLTSAESVSQRTADAYHQAHVAAARCMTTALAPDRDPGTDLMSEARDTYAAAMHVEHLLAAWLCSNAIIVGSLRAGAPMQGLPWAKRSIGLWMQLGSRRGFPWLEIYADLLAMAGRPERAVTLFAAAQGASSRVGSRFPRLPISRSLYASTRETINRTAFDEAWRAGQGLTLDQVIEQDID